MNWVVAVWAAMAATCSTLAVVQLLVWSRDRASPASFWFALAALAVAGIAGGELAMMAAASPADFGRVQRWAHVPVAIALVAVAWFVQAFFGTGRRWLLLAATVLRGVVLALNFASPVSINYAAVTGLEGFALLGQVVNAPVGVPSPWAPVGALSSFLIAAFVLDAAWTAWRRAGARDRERAVVIGGSVVACIVLPTANALLVHFGWWSAPYFITVAFMPVVLAMAHELSGDLLKAASLVRDLRLSQARLELAGRAANVGLWTWYAADDRLWLTGEGQRLLGLAGNGPFTLADLLATADARDRPELAAAFARVRDGDGELAQEYLAARPGESGARAWRGIRGQPERDAAGHVRLIRGVVLDTSRRRNAELEREELRAELAHAGRVSMLGQLVATLTHELSQPLGAMRRNAEAAELLLQSPQPDLRELGDTIADVKRDGARAAGVVTSLRELLRRRAFQPQDLDVAALVADVMALVRPEAERRGVLVEARVATGLPLVRGDGVLLQQVLLNLVMNALEAVTGAAERRVGIVVAAGAAGTVEFAVLDTGPGIDAATAARLFEPFFTTRAGGMGMGLAICRSLVEAHGGRIWSDPDAARGAALRFALPVGGPP